MAVVVPAGEGHSPGGAGDGEVLVRRGETRHCGALPPLLLHRHWRGSCCSTLLVTKH